MFGIKLEHILIVVGVLLFLKFCVHITPIDPDRCPAAQRRIGNC
jgi:hypothetical protein